MEIVFDVLKVMGKVIFIEFVVRFDISCEEVLNELWELKKVGFVDKSVYIWCVVDNNVQQEQLVQVELLEEIIIVIVVKILECDLIVMIE